MPFYSIDKKELFSEIEENKRKIKAILLTTASIYVLAFLIIFILIVISYNEGVSNIAIYLFIALLLSIFISSSFIITAWETPLKVFRSSFNNIDGIRQVTTPNTKEEKILLDIVDEIMVAGLVEKRPEIYIIENDEPNAFALSKGNESIIAVTTGIMKIMNRAELSAVIGHELSHILNRDSEVKLLAFLFTTGIYLALYGFFRFFNPFHITQASTLSRSKAKSSFHALIIIVAIIAIFIVSYILSLLLSYYMSRKQEQNADLGSLKLTRDKEALISALKKLENYEKSKKEEKLKEQHAQIDKKEMALKEWYNNIPTYMFFWKPSFSNLLMTHPPISERIKYIESVF